MVAVWIIGSLGHAGQKRCHREVLIPPQKRDIRATARMGGVLKKELRHPACECAKRIMSRFAGWAGWKPTLRDLFFELWERGA